MKITDRSLPNSGGVLTNNRGCGTGCGSEVSQDPHIPQERNFTEVAIHEGAEEPCAAANVDAGGTVREVSTKAEAPRKPLTAYLNKGNISSNGVRSTAAHVASHPQLMRAHQAGSITSSDHRAMHGVEKCPASMTKKPGQEMGGEGTEEILDEKCAAAPSTVGSPSSAGCTMPAVTQKAQGSIPEFSSTPVVATPKGQWMRSRD
jgi:hypothetical protein